MTAATITPIAGLVTSVSGPGHGDAGSLLQFGALMVLR